MAAESRVVLHLDLDDSQAKQKYSQLESNITAKSVNVFLNLDISEAQARLDSFFESAKDRTIQANLKLEDSSPQAVTTLKLETNEARSAMQSFISEMGSHHVKTALELDVTQAQAKLQNALSQLGRQTISFDTSVAQSAFSNFMTHITSQNISTVLKLDISQAETALTDFIARARNQAVSIALNPDSSSSSPVTVLHLDTSSAKAEYENFLTYVQQSVPTSHLHLDTRTTGATISDLIGKIRNVSPLSQRTASDITQNVSRISSALTRLSGTVATVFSIQAIRNFVDETKAAWNVQLQAETKLETILGRNLQATKSQIQAAKDWASALQQVGVVGDEVQLSGLQELATYIKNPESLKTMNVVLNDMLAQQYGLNATAESAVTISTMLGKVLEGQTAALSRYGYFFDEAQEKLLKFGTEEQRVATIAQIVEDSVGGMNEALAKTPAGKLKQLKNYMGDIQEKFGQAATNIQVLFLPVLNRIADTFNAIALKAIEISEIFGDWFGIDLSRNITSAVSSTNDLTESLETAQEAAENLGAASFDNFDIIGTNSDEDDTPQDIIAPSLDMSGFDAALTDTGNRISETLQRFFSPLRNAWAEYGQPFLDSVIRAGDQVKTVFSDIGQSFAKVWMNGTGERTAGNLLILFTDIFDIIGDIAGAFSSAWEDDGRGTALIQSYADGFNNLLELIHSVNKAFRNVWNDGTGEDIFSNIFEILTNINRIFSNLEGRFQAAWEQNRTGERIFSGIFDIMNTVLSTINHITDKTAEWAGSIDFSPLLNSVSGVIDSLKPLTGHIGEGLEWLWTNILLPLAGFTIENLIPDFLNVLSGAIDVLDASVEALKPFGQWLWDSFIQPIAAWTGEIITTGLESLSDVLHDMGEWIRENPDSAVFIGGLTTAFIGMSKALTSGRLVRAISNIGKLAAIDLGALALTPVIAGAVAIASWGYVATEISKNYEDIKDVFEADGGLGGFLKGWAQDIGDGILDVAAEIEQMPFAEPLEKFGSWVYDVFHQSSDSAEEFSGTLEITEANIRSFTDTSNISISDFGDIWKSGMQNIKNAVSLTIGTLKENFQTGLDEIKSDISGKFRQARENIVSVFENIGDWFSGRWNDIRTSFADVGRYFSEKFQEGYENAKSAFSDIRAVFSEKWDGIKSVFVNTGNYFSEKFISAKEKIKSAFSGIGGVFTQVWDEIKSPFRSVADWFEEKFSNAWTRVKNVFSSGGSVFQRIQDGISSTFRNVVNGLIDGINTVVRVPFQGISEALNTVRGWWLWTPWGDFYPFEGLPEISIPELPRLAKGGLVSQPTLAMVGDNPNAQTDPEIISPLSKLRDMLPESSQPDYTAKLDELTELMNMLINAVYENAPVLKIGDKEIYAASERGRRKFRKMKGVS